VIMPGKEHTIYLLTGSNQGDPPAQLEKAAAVTGQEIGKITRFSSVYRTAPWGNTDQPSFYNQVLEVSTALTPVDLMLQVLLAEKEMGRVREAKWGPRIIDIDILFYEDRVVNEHNVTIPHPLLHERRFTLEPLCEIAPGFVHPVLKQTIRDLLSVCPDHSKVEKL
jgi:2-amino-4-hydroxy-6-hydroxymethyldihydropteridine diphosphokinase